MWPKTRQIDIANVTESGRFSSPLTRCGEIPGSEGALKLLQLGVNFFRGRIMVSDHGVIWRVPTTAHAKSVQF